MRAVFAKGTGNVLIPADPAAEQFIASLKLGSGAAVETKKVRNVRFHRKFFSLLQLAFDMWEPPGDKTWKGVPIRKDFERFREDITILAGHYDVSYALDGSVKMTAKSISFANCDEFEFEKVYQSVLDVVWDKILRESNFRSKAEVENVVNQLMAYSG